MESQTVHPACAHGNPGCGPVGKDTGYRANGKRDVISGDNNNITATSGRICVSCENFVCLDHAVPLENGNIRCPRCAGKFGEALPVKGQKSTANGTAPAAPGESLFQRVSTGRGRPTIVFPEEEKEKLVAKFKSQDNTGVVEIAKFYGVSPKIVSDILKEYGCEIKKGKRANGNEAQTPLH